MSVFKNYSNIFFKKKNYSNIVNINSQSTHRSNQEQPSEKETTYTTHSNIDKNIFCIPKMKKKNMQAYEQLFIGM